MSAMYCPSCGGELVAAKVVTLTLFDEVHYRVDFLPVVYCINCPLVSELDTERGRLADYNMSMSLVFERQQPRVTLVDYPLLRGRADS